MKIIIGFLIIAAMLALGCTEQNKRIPITKTVSHTWLDSIIANSDSSYIKPYKRTDFVTAVFYLNKKDSSVCQLMKDSAGHIRQVIIAKNDVRTFFAQYYPNGNIQADLPLDKFGQYHGTGTFYYENGTIQSTGSFNHGLKSGQWKIFDENGKSVSANNYDTNGQEIK